jgi:hypothetical protein
MAVILLAGIVCSVPKNLASGRRPHMVFHLKAESDGQIWLIRALDENEVGVERLSLGDAVAVTGHLDIGIEADKAGNRRICLPDGSQADLIREGPQRRQGRSDDPRDATDV